MGRTAVAFAMLCLLVPASAIAQSKPVSIARLLIDVCVPVVTRGNSINELLPIGAEPLDAASAAALGMSEGGWSYGAKGPGRVLVGRHGERCVVVDFNGPAAEHTLDMVEALAKESKVDIRIDGVVSKGQGRRYLVLSGLPAVMEIVPTPGIASMGVVYPVIERLEHPSAK